MSEEVFTASNGITIDEFGRVAVLGPDFSSQDAHEARAEFYQHLRDQELGRWRDPVDPDYVVYRIGIEENEVHVFCEKELHGAFWSREEVDESNLYRTFGRDTAKRYFEAHPGHKPWHHAQPGEVWIVTFEDKTSKEPYLVSEIEPGNFTDSEGAYFDTTDPGIVHAEKIYPKDEENK